MSTATVEVTITCPDWCEDDVSDHRDDIAQGEGQCIHHSTAIVPDTAGYVLEALGDRRFHGTVDLMLGSCTRPDGHECSSPLMYLNGGELSLRQALDVAGAIRSMVTAYEAAGGAIEPAIKVAEGDALRV